jgi:DNA-binding YbaB/EbfC family protein
MGTGFSKKKKEARLFQQQFQQFQTELQETEVTGTAGLGLVTITLSGEGNLKKIKIKPECVDPEDVEGLELLIKTAHDDAKNKLKDTSKNIPNMPKLGF